MADMADTTYTAEQLRPIFEHFARAASHSREAWIEMEKALPKVRQICPEFYVTIVDILKGAYENNQIIEMAADELLADPSLLDPNTRIGIAKPLGVQ